MLELLLASFFFFYSIFNAFAAAHIAKTKGRVAGAWFILGLVFGVFAVLAVGFCETAEEAERQRKLLAERRDKKHAQRQKRFERPYSEGDQDLMKQAEKARKAGV